MISFALVFDPTANSTDGLRNFQELPFGQQVKIIRERLRIGQRELAERLGTSQPAVSQIEAALRPRPETVTRVAAALKVREEHGSLVPPWMEPEPPK